tara:strand:- start:602 stop:868 length:267 start_codon:yes stop_codon:yes gene_type:complete
MTKFFFVTIMMLNLDTGLLVPKYHQQLFFYDRVKCESYVQQNFTALKNGFGIYMDTFGINGQIKSLGCTEMSREDIEKMLEDSSTIST